MDLLNAYNANCKIISINYLMDLPQQSTNTAVHAAPGQQVYVTVDTGGHMASPAQVYFDQVSLKKNLCVPSYVL